MNVFICFVLSIVTLTWVLNLYTRQMSVAPSISISGGHTNDIPSEFPMPLRYWINVFVIGFSRYLSHNSRLSNAR